MHPDDRGEALLGVLVLLALIGLLIGIGAGMMKYPDHPFFGGIAGGFLGVGSAVMVFFCLLVSGVFGAGRL